MKYLITENKFNSSIYKFIDKLFSSEDGNNEIHTLPGVDENGEELVDTYDFVNGDYYGDNGSDYIFSWTGKEYYKSLFEDGTITKFELGRLYSQSPIVEIIDKNALNQLNGYFGDKWTPVFKQWFKDKTGLDFKTLYS